MSHVIINEPFLCPKCNKMNSGASIAILDFMVCPDCFYTKFRDELQPKIDKLVREYFQGEAK